MKQTKQLLQEAARQAQEPRRQWVVVSYDIADDKRRTKVMHTMEGYGRRAQYSVFECELRHADLVKLKEKLRTLIAKEVDDIRFYPLCEACLAKATMLGKAKVYRPEPYEIVKEKR